MHCPELHDIPGRVLFLLLVTLFRTEYSLCENTRAGASVAEARAAKAAECENTRAGASGGGRAPGVRPGVRQACARCAPDMRQARKGRVKTPRKGELPCLSQRSPC